MPSNLNKRVLAAGITVAVLHGAACFAPLPGLFRFVAVVGLDLFFAGFLVMDFRAFWHKPADLEAVEEPTLEEVPEAAPPIQAVLAAPPVPDAAVARTSEEARETMQSCLDLGRLLVEGNERLRGSRGDFRERFREFETLQETARIIQENASRIFEISSNLSGSAEQAFNLSHDVQAEVSSMAGELASSHAETESLLAESKKITEILTIMSEISSTTHVLSINATIVAANAGANGKQFAVVAKEIRKLAENTESSLEDISAMVHTVQEKVRVVSEKIGKVSAGITNEKTSLLSVAGNLQGVMLAMEVIKTVSTLCMQKSAEEEQGCQSVSAKVDATLHELESLVSDERVEGFRTNMEKIAEIAESF